MQGELKSATQESNREHDLRLALSEDLPQLSEVERSAASIFRSVPELSWVAEGATVSADLLSSLCSAQTLWVATSRDAGCPVVAFLAAYCLDSCLYIAEMSVAAAYQRKGLGAALMKLAEDQGKARGYGKISLTTDRYLLWNKPFYTKLGFQEAFAHELGGEHVKKLAEEVAAGFESKRRCVMVKHVEAQVKLEAT